ncbi:uncharacterized protein LOC101846512 [Aplysia californica]|uniref:Uncharacterized protein LOC101846512 n=1 Tax=Aplysia californica TaxID=6500 RepID=A0ABM1VVE1_APLCA|nr:uncharacterized protein LOC101846512 [Aplysia californica]
MHQFFTTSLTFLTLSALASGSRPYLPPELENSVKKLIQTGMNKPRIIESLAHIARRKLMTFSGDAGGTDSRVNQTEGGGNLNHVGSDTGGDYFYYLDNSDYELPPDDRSFTCMVDILSYEEGLRSGHTWALSMVDATGSPGPGLLRHQFHWLGQYSECKEVKATITTQSNSSESSGSDHRDVMFTGRSCLVIHVPSVDGVPRVGEGRESMWEVCMPSSCDGPALVDLFNEVLASFNLSSYLTVVYSVCGSDGGDDGQLMEESIPPVVFVLVLPIVAVIVATLMDFLLDPSGKLQKKRVDTASNKVSGTPSSSAKENPSSSIKEHPSNNAKENHSNNSTQDIAVLPLSYMRKGEQLSVSEENKDTDQEVPSMNTNKVDIAKVGPSTNKDKIESSTNTGKVDIASVVQSKNADKIDIVEVEVSNSEGKSSDTLDEEVSASKDTSDIKQVGPSASAKSDEESGTAAMNDLSSPKTSSKQQTTLMTSESERGTCETGIRARRDNLFLRLLLCWSLRPNVRSLLATTHSQGSLQCVHGIRVLSCVWVMLGHASLLLLVGHGLQEFMYQQRQVLAYQIVNNFTLSVDSFFVLGGLLVAFNLLEELEKRGGKKNWFFFVLHRYLRITPLYMAALVMDTFVAPHLTDGPLRTAINENACRFTWWANLFYVNNLAPNLNGCMGWCWYLATDMQCYLLSPLIIVPLFRRPVLGYIIAAFFFVATSVIPFVLTVVYRYGTDVTFVEGHTEPLNKFRDNLYYFPVFSRMGPYVVGIMLGFLLFKQKGKQQTIPRVVNACGWAVATALALAVLYGQHSYVKRGYKEGINLYLAGAYNGLARSTWGICLAWLIYNCHHGYGGPVNKFLSWRAWLPLGRLSFCVYVMHVVVLKTDAASAQSLPFVSTSYFISIFSTMTLVTFLLSAGMYVCYELPIPNMERVLLRRFAKNAKT